MNAKKDQKTKDAEVKKQNQDFPNIPAATEKIEDEKKVEKEIKKSSKLHEDGKTDNTDQNTKK